MKLSLTGWLILLNVVGAIAYLVVGSRLWWIEPELADVPGASGGAAFIWFPVSMYFACAFGIANFAALLCHFLALYRRRGQKLSIYTLSIPVIWMLTIWIDYRHHGI
ncbi:hypothetical protein GALL_161520 [mine drainage metagenome]|uniref:Uncharacterized protein n=1 Tax=mine drainage metagenome TaxID=410659 RepID=A0A1J5S179_9ZZZZ